MGAEAKAKNAAACAGLALTGVIELEELDVKVSRSGAFGDQDWMAFPAAAGGGVSSDSDEPLEAASRSSSIRFRVRFAAEPVA